MSKLASYLAAVAIAVFLATGATALAPSLKANLDAAGGQLLSVVGVIVGAGLNYLFLHLGLSSVVQGVILAVLQAAMALFLPAIHLQQATLHRGGDSRPT